MQKRASLISESTKRVKHDLVALGIAIAAILMFLGTGTAVLPQIMRKWIAGAPGPDNLLVNALLLNIALIIFGMRRYRELVSEIEERRKAEETARVLAETDPLTGCLNRRSIGPATDAMITDSIEGCDSIAFLMLDLDNFKQVNDLHGHSVGDSVLTLTAERIRSILPPEAVLARLGG
ncbi:MAG: GGDEF domain-containing protein, partial [Pontixanthobacter sp.]